MKKLILTFFTVALVVGFAMAQDNNDNNIASHTVAISVPEVAKIDIEDESVTGITFTLVAPTEAGLGLIAPAVNSSYWLNLSSTVKKNSTGRTVSAKISTGTLLTGMTLKVQASAPTADGKGTKGTSSGLVTLTGSDQPVITTVKNGYTGNGTLKGFQLTYTLVFDDSDAAYNALENDTPTNLTITYTMSGD